VVKTLRTHWPITHHRTVRFVSQSVLSPITLGPFCLRCFVSHQKSPLLIKEVTSEVHAANREVHSQMVRHGERVSKNSVGHLQSSSLREHAKVGTPMLPQDAWGKCTTRKKIFSILDWFKLQSTKKNHAAHLFVAPYEILRH
jgi:hypothetical protein